MGIARGGTYLIPWNAYNFFYLMWMKLYTGVRREGIYAGVMMLSAQIFPGPRPVYCWTGLEAFGFTKGAESQDAAALNGIWWYSLSGRVYSLCWRCAARFAFV